MNRARMLGAIAGLLVSIGGLCGIVWCIAFAVGYLEQRLGRTTPEPPKPFVYTTEFVERCAALRQENTNVLISKQAGTAADVVSSGPDFVCVKWREGRIDCLNERGTPWR